MVKAVRSWKRIWRRPSPNCPVCSKRIATNRGPSSGCGSTSSRSHEKRPLGIGSGAPAPAGLRPCATRLPLAASSGSSPTVRDRVVQTALAYVLEPIFERHFAEHSHGFRPGRHARQAIVRVEALLAQGQTWVVDADLKGYFDSIPQDKLLAAVEKKIADGRLLRLLEKYLQQGVLETGSGGTPPSN